MSVRGYTVGVNWSRGPDYTATLEDVSSYVAKETNVVASWGRSAQNTSADAESSKLTFDLLNNTRVFSPENTSSPIYGVVPAGTPSRLQYSGTTVLSGVVGEFEAGSGSASQFTATVDDEWVRAGDFTLSTAVYQGQRTGDLIGIILDAIGWTGGRDLDPGVTLVPYWWAEGTTAKQAVLDLVHSDGEPAIAYVRNGVFVFRDRHHRLTRTQSLTSQGTHSHIFPSGPLGTDFKILKDTLVYDHGLARIANSATLEVTPRFPSDQSIVWETEDPILLASFEVRTIFIQADDPFINLQVPNDTNSYFTSDRGFLYDYELDAGGLSFTLSRTSGQSAILTLTAISSGAVINGGLRVRGTALKAVSGQKFTADDTTSQATYGVLQWQGEAPWAYYYDAQAIVDQAVATYATPQPSVTFDIEGRLSAGTMARILAAEISDRITVRADPLGVNGDFHIERLIHKIQQLGVKHTLTVGAQVCAPVQASNPFQFNVAGHGFNQGQFTAFAGNSPSAMFRFNTAGQGFDQGVFAT